MPSMYLSILQSRSLFSICFILKVNPWSVDNLHTIPFYIFCQCGFIRSIQGNKINNLASIQQTNQKTIDISVT